MLPQKMPKEFMGFHRSNKALNDRNEKTATVTSKRGVTAALYFYKKILRG